MDLQKASTLLKTIKKAVENKHLKSAFEGINQLNSEQHNYQINQRLEELETNYKYMLHYFAEGNNDPQQELIYNRLIRDTYLLAQDAAEIVFMQHSSFYFYEKARLQTVRNPILLDEHRDNIIKQMDTFSFIELFPEGEEKSNRLFQNTLAHERTIEDLFNSTYASWRADSAMIESYRRFIDNEIIPVSDKSMLISALTMNIIHRLDDKKTSFLFDVSQHPEQEIAIRAIVGLIAIFQKYKSWWYLFPECTNRLKLLADDNVFCRRFMTSMIQFIQARETEKITQRLRDEIIPEMMKLSPIIGKKIDLDEWLGEKSEVEDKNPEWQKILEESGLGDKLKEFTDLQMEGADIFHSTFSNLKLYPFFHEMNNWFLPFTPFHTQITKYSNNKPESIQLLNTISTTSMMCDSDKYSFAFSLVSMPEQYQKMITSQLSAESEGIKEMQEEDNMLLPHQKEENSIKQYIQDLYRFFKLFKRKDEFTDIFALPLNYHLIDAFYPIVHEQMNLDRIALYYFEKNNFQEALEAYSQLSEINPGKCEIWQKIGYCRQMLGDVKKALDAYLRAELIDGNNTWLLRKIAQCYRILKQPETALIYYRRLEQLKPDDFNIQLNIGHCFLELRKYDEALNYYFKVELSDSENTRAWRSISWCAFLSRKFEVAQRYYGQILEKSPTTHDYLNAGHVELCINNIKKAIELYEKANEKEGNFESFQKLLREDEEELKMAGIDTKVFPLLLDKIKYDRENS